MTVALVTGAAGAIGSATALLLARGEADIVATDLTLDALGEVERAVGELGRSCLTVAGDLASVDDALRIARAADGWTGRVDILVNNAATLGATQPPDVTADDWDRLFAVNVRAPFVLAQELSKTMLRGDGGAIVNVTAIAGEISTGPQVPYQATKAGLIQMTRALAHIWAPRIRVNAVSPGFVPTRLNREFLAANHDAIVARTPFARTGTVDEVAEAIAFLASPAAAYITGENLRIDGGYSIADR